jgi:hypothetical protein
MTIVRRVGGLLHRLTHRVPAVPPHVEQSGGHQGPANPRRRLSLPAGHLSANRRWNHSPARPPRVLAAWQWRIGALFGQQR